MFKLQPYLDLQVNKALLAKALCKHWQKYNGLPRKAYIPWQVTCRRAKKAEVKVIIHLILIYNFSAPYKSTEEVLKLPICALKH